MDQRASLGGGSVARRSRSHSRGSMPARQGLRAPSGEADAVIKGQQQYSTQSSSSDGVDIQSALYESIDEGIYDQGLSNHFLFQSTRKLLFASKPSSFGALFSPRATTMPQLQEFSIYPSRFTNGENLRDGKRSRERIGNDVMAAGRPEKTKNNEAELFSSFS